MTAESKYDRTSATSLNASNNPSSSANQAAALRGASLAFGKPPIKPKPNTSAYKGNNGALTAATIANNSTGTRAEDERLRPQQSGGSSGYSSVGGISDSGTARRTSGHFSKSDASGHLKLPGDLADRTTSPSFIAAALAASRSAPLSPSHTGQMPKSPSPRRSSGMISPSNSRSMSRQREVLEDSLDISSIPPTTSLIGMFEKSGIQSLAQRPKPGVIAVARARAPEIKSPRPIRAHPVAIQPDIIIPSSKPPHIHHGSVPSTPAKKPNSPVYLDGEDDASSDDSFVSASDTRPLPIPPPVHKKRPPSISPSINSMTVDSLANAIVASSLASSRTASPTKSGLSGPPLPPPRRNKNPSLFHHHHDTRTPSPAKGFRQTMRKPKDEDEEDHNMLRMGKKNLMKKHPNKHHEGDRKRWRDSITERERKRYEAVWASNRGLFLSDSNVTTSFPLPPRAGVPLQSQYPDLGQASESVSNLVVRDIWSRSRLGDETLAEVWDLVDRSGAGKLSREEFVTGLWLIDQRLKGRKLPIRVSSSVWASAGSSIGVKVRRKK